MNFKKPLALTLSLTVFCAAFFGCASETGANSAGIADLTAGLTAKQISYEAPKNVQPLTDFALSMLCASLSEENTVLSPLSAYYVYSLTANGAKGDTLSQFESVLGGTPEETNLLCAQLEKMLSSTSGSTTLTLANSVWVDQDFKANQDFLQTAVDSYNAGIFSADLPTEDTKNAINQWVSEQTSGKIKNFLTQNPSDDAVLMLLNAIYLDAAWETPFDPNDTTDGYFTTESGDEVDCSYLNYEGTRTYLRGDGFIGVLLPYDDGSLAMLALLPTNGQSVAELAKSLTSAQLQQVVASAQDTRMSLSIPKFSITTQTDLKSVLQSMGLSDAFDMDRADITGLGTSDDTLFISNSLQKAMIEVGEKGTTAAAASSIEISAKTALPEGLSVCFDSPFIYAVVERTTLAPLFIGTVMNP